LTGLIKYQFHQYDKTILVGILMVTISIGGIVFGPTKISIHEPIALILQPAQADLFLVPFDQLSREAELIILGHVLDEKLLWEGSVGAALENHTVSIEKVLTKRTTIVMIQT
jgi:hypothetical protein